MQKLSSRTVRRYWKPPAKMSGVDGGEKSDQKPTNWKSIVWSTGFSVTFFVVIITMFYLESTSPKPHFIQMVNSKPKTKVKQTPPVDKESTSENVTISREVLRNLMLETHEVVGASTKQGRTYGYLKPRDHQVVPNVAHYVWFTCHPFKFENLVSILSVHRVMKAEYIYFHTDCEPTGRWWEEAKDFIPTLIVVLRTPPKKIFQRELNAKWTNRLVDVASIEILKESGGVYISPDVFVLAPLDPLRYFDYVVGKVDTAILSTDIVIAKKDSVFLKLYYESFNRFKDNCWECTVVKGHYDLAMKNLKILHIEPESLAKPPDSQWQDLFTRKYDWKNNHFTIRTLIDKYRETEDFTAENIKTLDSAFGQMCRYIYYGKPDLIMDR